MTPTQQISLTALWLVVPILVIFAGYLSGRFKALKRQVASQQDSIFALKGFKRGRLGWVDPDWLPPTPEPTALTRIKALQMHYVDYLNINEPELAATVLKAIGAAGEQYCIKPTSADKKERLVTIIDTSQPEQRP